MADPISGNQIFNPLPPSSQWGKSPGMTFRQTEEFGSNLGGHDSRRPVIMGEKEFDSVVVLDGDKCTGTLSTISGYDVSGEGSIVVTAAHCVEGYDNDAISITGSFLDEQGTIQTYEMQSEKIWIHPHYLEKNEAVDNGNVNSQSDVAIIYTSEPTPQSIIAAEFQTVDILAGIEEHKDTAKSQMEDNPNALNVAVAGYSSDLMGLNIHDRAEISSVIGQTITSDADTAAGASGGPN